MATRVVVKAKEAKPEAVLLNTPEFGRLTTGYSLTWPPFCICCNAGASDFKEYGLRQYAGYSSGAFQYETQFLKIPYCKHCQKHASIWSAGGPYMYIPIAILFSLVFFSLGVFFYFVFAGSKQPRIFQYIVPLFFIAAGILMIVILTKTFPKHKSDSQLTASCCTQKEAFKIVAITDDKYELMFASEQYAEMFCDANETIMKKPIALSEVSKTK